MDVVVTGSSGLIGSALVSALKAAGHRPIAMVRSAPKGDQIAWDPAKGTIDAASLEGVDAVVHLAGAGIGDRRWTDEYKRVLVDSRVDSTRLLADRLAELDGDGPSTLLSGSAIGFYGDRGDDLLDESSPNGEGFLAEICRRWEEAADPARVAGLRVAYVRTGIVLTPRGGALTKLGWLTIFKLGGGGRFGNGRQWWSWISLTDEVRAIDHLLTSDLSGPVNLTAPNPVRNADFARTLGRVLGRPSFLTVPAIVPKLLLGGELADAVLFDSQRVHPTVLEADGFGFEHPDLAAALRAELGR
jgi:uncharacterized protein (TIGR01777 family)